MTRTAISPRLATRTVSNIACAALIGCIPSHPEDAVAGRRGFLGRAVGQRGARARGEGEAEHRTGLQRVDHPVVPQPRRGVVRAALSLVLLADRRPERLLVLRAPLLAARFQLVALDGREDG